jgi:hypothetical protein
MLPIPSPKYSDLQFVICEMIAQAGYEARNDGRIIALSEPYYRGSIPLPTNEISAEMISDYVFRTASCGWRRP